MYHHLVSVQQRKAPCGIDAVRTGVDGLLADGGDRLGELRNTLAKADGLLDHLAVTDDLGHQAWPGPGRAEENGTSLNAAFWPHHPRRTASEQRTFALGLLGVDLVAGQTELHRARLADGADQPLRATSAYVVRNRLEVVPALALGW